MPISPSPKPQLCLPAPLELVDHALALFSHHNAKRYLISFAWNAMQPRLLHSVARAAPAARIPSLTSHLRISFFNASPSYHASVLSRRAPLRPFSVTTSNFIQERTDTSSNSQPARDLNNNVTEEEKKDFDQKVAEDKGKQIRTPWHREGSDIPPVSRLRSAGAMTKGKHSHSYKGNR